MGGHVRDDINRIPMEMEIYVAPRYYKEDFRRDFEFNVTSTKNRGIRIRLEQRGELWSVYLGDLIIAPNSIVFKEWRDPYSKPTHNEIPIWPLGTSIAKAGKEEE